MQGAQIADLRRDGLDNLFADRARIDVEHPDQVSFGTYTRGHRDSLLLLLSGAGAGAHTSIVIRLEEARGLGPSRGLTSQPAPIPAQEIRLDFSDLRNGRLVRDLPLGAHIDRVTLEVVVPDGPMDRQLEFLDLTETGASDYYYLRVTQVDGERAWSSPFWVGESLR